MSFVPTPFVMRSQKGASFCYLTCLVCVFYQLYKASIKEMILKNSRAISISVTLHIYTSNKLTILAQLLTSLRVSWLYLHWVSRNHGSILYLLIALHYNLSSAQLLWGNGEWVKHKIWFYNLSYYTVENCRVFSSNLNQPSWQIWILET